MFAVEITPWGEAISKRRVVAPEITAQTIDISQITCRPTVAGRPLPPVPKPDWLSEVAQMRQARVASR